jgi:hypothetical protein
VQTLHHGFDRDLLRERVGEDVPRRDLDRLLPQVVLQDDEARVELRGVAEDGFPVGEDLLGRGRRVEVEVLIRWSAMLLCGRYRTLTISSEGSGGTESTCQVSNRGQWRCYEYDR